jgi:RNA polymerase sigma-70 factor (ECF subfamily)
MATRTIEPSDEQLVAAFVDGDDAAFDALVNRYERRVFAICYRYFRDAQDAEDAAQDAFVALLRRAGTFSGAASFSTWMYRVATNACNDLARKRARRPRSVDAEITAVLDGRVSERSAEEAFGASSLDPALVRALVGLDVDTRAAIVLHDVYGVPYADIAQRAGVAVGTVKSRIHRGHATLAAALAAGQEPAGNPDQLRDLQPPTP